MFHRCQEQFAYGHADWLMTYAGIDEGQYLTGRLPHNEWGFPQSHSYLRTFRGPRGQRLPIWTWSSAWEAAYNQNGVENALAIGAPWVYAAKSQEVPLVWDETSLISDGLVRGQSTLGANDKILYVPTHSWERDVLDLGTVSRVLSEILPPDRTTVLLGWPDFLSRRIRLDLELAGYAIDCAGYRGSSFAPSSPAGDRREFFPNLFRIFQAHDVVVSDSVCTALMYAGSMGRRIGVPEELVRMRRFVAEALRSDYRTAKEFRQALDAADAQAPWLVGNVVDPKCFALELKRCLGGDRVLEPSDLRACLKFNSIPGTE